MHRWILGAAAWLAAAQVIGQPASAPACVAPKEVVERFMDADCERCWSGPAGAALAAGTWALDWITPSARGAGAALAVAALGEAAERRAAVHALQPLAPSGEATWSVAARPALRLTVQGGPAWNGYLGLQLSTRGKAPTGTRAYLALIEDVPAEAAGNASARRLVRAVAGPIALGSAPARELRALRVPEDALAERLIGVAWWVDRDERLLGIAAEGCPR